MLPHETSHMGVLRIVIPLKQPGVQTMGLSWRNIFGRSGPAAGFGTPLFEWTFGLVTVGRLWGWDGHS